MEKLSDVFGNMDEIAENLGIWFWVIIGIVIVLALGLVVWGSIVFGWGVLYFIAAISLAVILGHGANFMTAVSLAFLTKLLLGPIAAISSVWWTHRGHGWFFQTVRQFDPLTLASLIFLVLFVLAVARRAVADTFRALARHTHVERNNTNSTEREVIHS